MGKFIRDGFSRAYDHVEAFTGAIWDSEDKKYIGADGSEVAESLFEILYNTEQIFCGCYTDEEVAELLEDIISESGLSYRDKKHGGMDYFEEIHSPQFVIRDSLYGKEITSEHIAWERFKSSCKYFNRYFDLSYDSDRANLLSSLKSIFNDMEDYIDSNLELYRIRKFELKDDNSLYNINYYREIAPAPYNCSKNSRMSPSGISYMYLSTSINTAVKETRLKENDCFLAGKFSAKRKIRILNLSKVPSIQKVSIFSDEYNHSWCWITEFIEGFIREISKPIDDKEKDIEYVATQVLSEYIRKLGYEGIKFTSSVQEKSYNIVLFCGPNPDLCRDVYGYQTDNYMAYELEHFTNWVKLNEIYYYELMDKNLTFKLIDELKEISDLPRKSLLPNSTRIFYRIEDIEEELVEIQNITLGNYTIYLNNTKMEDLSIREVVKAFIDRNKSYKTKFSLTVQQMIDSIRVSIAYNNIGDSEFIDISFIDKDAKNIWESLIPDLL